jgi:hypothetical protein
MKTLLSVLLFVAFALTCNAQTKANSVEIENSEYALTELSQMSQSVGIYIDSIVCNRTTMSASNALVLAKAANIDNEKVKLVCSPKQSIIIYFREEIMIGDY